MKVSIFNIVTTSFTQPSTLSQHFAYRLLYAAALKTTGDILSRFSERKGTIGYHTHQQENKFPTNIRPKLFHAAFNSF